MTARDCPSNPFQAKMIFPLKKGEREEVAESHPAVPVLIQGQQLEGMHGRSVHVSEKWVRMDQSVPASGSGRAMLTRLVAAQWQQVGRAPGLSPGAVLTPHRCHRKSPSPSNRERKYDPVLYCDASSLYIKNKVFWYFI